MAVQPRVFIGSSTRELGPASVVQQNLAHYAEVRIWSQGVFALSQAAIESLMAALEWADFGVFVFTPDDAAEIKAQKVVVARDNVLFELRLFIGRLGRQRSFFVQPDLPEPMHLPTDLLSVTPAGYLPPANPADLYALQAALGSACTSIRAAIQKAPAACQAGQVRTG